MKKILAVFALIVTLLIAGDQRTDAGITCPLPINLQNNTIADATQVMANFNAITACFLNNIAASGANNDITGLFALTTPIAPVNGGTPIYLGGNSTGVNTQVISTTVPSNFALTAGRSVLFFPGNTNSGAMTLDVASSGAINVFKRTPTGIVAAAGGEVVAGQPVIVTYDGTQWILVTPYIKLPTIQTFTSGTGVTYTTPAGAIRLVVRLVGGGGGGGGGNGAGASSGGTSSWVGSGTTSAGGGSAGGGNGGSGGSGGVVTGTCDVISLPGTAGGTSPNTGVVSGAGGGTGLLPGAPAAAANGNGGIAGVTGAGTGASGGSTSSGIGGLNGGGGGGGATCEFTILNPSATYTYTVGASGGGGAGTGGGGNGGAGGSGSIRVMEYYQ